MSKNTKDICDVCGEEEAHRQLPNGDWICYSCDKCGMAKPHENSRRLVTFTAALARANYQANASRNCNCEDFPCCGH